MHVDDILPLTIPTLSSTLATSSSYTPYYLIIPTLRQPYHTYLCTSLTIPTFALTLSYLPLRDTYHIYLYAILIIPTFTGALSYIPLHQPYHRHIFYLCTYLAIGRVCRKTLSRGSCAPRGKQGYVAHTISPPAFNFFLNEWLASKSWLVDAFLLVLLDPRHL